MLAAAWVLFPFLMLQKFNLPTEIARDIRKDLRDIAHPSKPVDLPGCEPVVPVTAIAAPAPEATFEVPPAPPRESDYHYIDTEGVVAGPVSAEELRDLVAIERAGGATLIHWKYAPDWRPLRDMPEIYSR